MIYGKACPACGASSECPALYGMTSSDHKVPVGCVQFPSKLVTRQIAPGIYQVGERDIGIGNRNEPRYWKCP